MADGFFEWNFTVRICRKIEKKYLHSYFEENMFCDGYYGKKYFQQYGLKIGLSNRVNTFDLPLSQNKKGQNVYKNKS